LRGIGIFPGLCEVVRCSHLDDFNYRLCKLMIIWIGLKVRCALWRRL
jgi:hypothetical protein